MVMTVLPRRRRRHPPLTPPLLQFARLHRLERAERHGRHAHRPRFRGLHRGSTHRGPQRRPVDEELHRGGRLVLLTDTRERRPRAVCPGGVELVFQTKKMT